MSWASAIRTSKPYKLFSRTCADGSPVIRKLPLLTFQFLNLIWKITSTYTIIFTFRVLVLLRSYAQPCHFRCILLALVINASFGTVIRQQLLSTPAILALQKRVPLPLKCCFLLKFNNYSAADETPYTSPCSPFPTGQAFVIICAIATSVSRNFPDTGVERSYFCRSWVRCSLQGVIFALNAQKRGWDTNVIMIARQSGTHWANCTKKGNW